MRSSPFGVHRFEDVFDDQSARRGEWTDVLHDVVDGEGFAAAVSSASRNSWSERPEPAARAASLLRTSAGTLRMVIATVMSASAANCRHLFG